jgi:hypothetical protein
VISELFLENKAINAIQNILFVLYHVSVDTNIRQVYKILIRCRATSQKTVQHQIQQWYEAIQVQKKKMNENRNLMAIDGTRIRRYKDDRKREKPDADPHSNSSDTHIRIYKDVKTL